MEYEEAIKILWKSSLLRKKYFEQNFFDFCQFYFIEYYSFDTPKCLIEYYEALESWKNVYFKWFRGSAKTTIAQMYVSYCIAYKTRRNIMWYSQTIDNAEENLTYIANSFINDTDQWERFCRDYGNLYYPETVIKQGQKKIKRIDKFVTENKELIEKIKKELAKEKVNNYLNDMKNIGITYEEAFKYLQELGGNK